MDNDYELLMLAQENDELAINELFKKYNNLLYTKARLSSSNINIDDYLNEAKLALYNAIFSYKDKNTFYTYLSVCVDRSLINYTKSLNRNKNKILNEAISIEDNYLLYKSSVKTPENTFFEELEYQELRNKIVNKLTWKEELVFNLKEQDYSIKEISEITDNSLKTVYNIINRIKNKVTNLVSN